MARNRQNKKKGHGPAPKKVNNEKIRAKADSIVAPICEAEGIELLYVEYQREPAGWILRLYIDREGGVKLEDCIAVSRQAGDALDVYLEVDIPYRLEVSSPGIERPLGKEKDFEKFAGRTAKVKLKEPIDGRKNCVGEILGAARGEVRLLMDGKEMLIPIEMIARAKLRE